MCTYLQPKIVTRDNNVSFRTKTIPDNLIKDIPTKHNAFLIIYIRLPFYFSVWPKSTGVILIMNI